MYIYIYILKYVYIFTYKAIYSYVIIEADKSQALQSASWRLRRASGVFVPVTVQARFWRQGKTVREREFAFTVPLCSSQSFDGLGEAHPHQEDQCALLSQLIQMLISFTDPPSLVNYLGTPQPSQTDAHLTITLTRTKNSPSELSLLSLACYCSVPRQDTDC